MWREFLMTRLSAAWNALATRLGWRKRMKKTKRTVPDRYRRYAIAKSKIPMNLTPTEYEAEIKRLARKYKI